MRTLARMMAAAAFAAAAAPAWAQHALVTLPLDDPAYVQLDALVRQGCALARPSVARPYETGLVREALARMATEAACQGPILEFLAARFADSATVDSTGSALRFGGAATVRATTRREREFRPLWRDVRPDDEGDPTVVGRAAARVTWAADPRVVAVVEGFAQSNRRNDPTLRGRGFRETEGVVDVSEAYIAGRLGPVTVQLGRSAEAWLGEGRESLVLSAHGPPVDRLRAAARWSRFEANAFFGSLNDVVLGTEDGLADDLAPQRFHRFLAVHSLTWRPRPHIELTLGESALLTRRGGGVDLAFVNPLMLYVVAENDTGRTGGADDDNNLTAFGAARVTLGRANLTAELLVDDIQIDSKDRENVPDQLGWRIGGSVALPLALPASLGIEYRRSSSYTYLRDNYAEVYQAWDQPLGSELGPAADEVRATGELWANGRLRLAGALARWRRGALRIDARPSTGAVGHAGEPFPSVTAERPEVQNAWLGDVAIQFLDRALPVTVRAEVARLDDVNNQPGSPATDFRVSIAGTYRFRYP